MGGLLQAARAAGLFALLAGLAGCKGGGPVGAGVDLFHDLQGGVIAQQRPPPPGVNDPFPSIGSIPARPAAPDIVAQQHIADQLAAQRDQAEQAAAANPLTPRAPPPALPKPAAAPDPNANRVVVDAAPTPVAAKAAPPSAPAAPKPGSDIPGLAAVPAVGAAVVSGPLPSLADAPPPAPVGLGALPTLPGAPPVDAVKLAALPKLAAAAAPAGSPAAPATAAAAAAPTKSFLDTVLSPTAVPGPIGDTIYKPPAIPVAGSVAIAFTPGSAVLPPSAPLDLRRFALAHRGVPVTVTGHGDEVLSGPDSQSRALDLALRRAQAIAAALGTAGIPAANLRLHAEAAGHGGSVTL